MLVEAIRTQTLPYSLQFAGLAMGILGALLLTIPDHLKSLWDFVTCQNENEQAEKEESTAEQLIQLKA